MNFRAVTVSTIDGDLSTIGGSLNYVEKNNDLSITKCASVLFGANPYPVCSHLGPTFSTLNVNMLSVSGNAGYEEVISGSVGAASYIDLYADLTENVTYKAMYNHQVNTLGVYKTSSTSDKDELYHSSYRDESFTIDGFGYGRSKDELIVYTPYNSPSKFHLVRLTSSSSAEYIGVTAEQTCGDRIFELTGGKDIYISGDEVLVADDKTVYYFKLHGNGTVAPYDDFYSCQGYFDLASSVEATFNETNNIVFKVNGGLYVFDKKSISAGPQLIPLLSNVKDLAIANDLLYIVDTLSYSTIKVFDISTPSAPEFLFSDPSYVQIISMITSGDYLFVHDIGTMKISVSRISNDRRSMNRFSSLRIPVENFFNYSELAPVATDKEIIFPMYDYGYVKQFSNE